MLDAVALSLVVAIEKAPRSEIDGAALLAKDTAPIRPIAIKPAKRDERPSTRLGARSARHRRVPTLTAALSIDVGAG